jgi:hypothetical protein
MSCVYHPSRDSITFCDNCEAALCQSCVIRLEDRRTLCHRCMLAVSLEDVKSETTVREQEEEERRVGLQKKWRPTYIHLVLAVGLTVLLILLALRLYWNQTEPRPAVVLDISEPVEVLAALQETLARYAVDHGNRYPDSLYDLMPAYLPDLDVNNKALPNLEYNLDEKNGYLLRIKADSPLSGKNLLATKLDIYPTPREE